MIQDVQTRPVGALRPARGRVRIERPRPRRDARELLIQTGVVVLAVIVWYLFSLTPLAQNARMPGPGQTIVRFGELAVTEPFWVAIGATVLAWALALLLSIVVGIPVGLAIGRSKRAQDSTHFAIDFLRTIPALALVPLLLLLMGPTLGMVVSAAFLTAVWPVLIQSIYAGRLADPALHQMARSFRLSRWDRVRYVLTPDALAFIWPGLRLAVTASLLSTVAAQLIGAAPGIGSAILLAQLSDRTDSLFAYVLAACFLGLMINALLMWAQRKVLWWHPSMRDRTK